MIMNDFFNKKVLFAYKLFSFVTITELQYFFEKNLTISISRIVISLFEYGRKKNVLFSVLANATERHKFNNHKMVL